MHFLFAPASKRVLDVKTSRKVLLIYHSTLLALSKTLNYFRKAVKLVFFSGRFSYPTLKLVFLISYFYKALVQFSSHLHIELILT